MPLAFHLIMTQYLTCTSQWRHNHAIKTEKVSLISAYLYFLNPIWHAKLPLYNEFKMLKRDS